MKTLLNLLPEEKKDSIQRHLRFRFLLWQLFLLFLLEVFYLCILVSIYLILDFQLKSLQSIGESSMISSQAQERQLSEYQKKFQETNTLSDRVGKIDRSHLKFANVFTLLDGLLPEGVLISNLKTEEYTVSLLGKAAKREDLLALDERLKNAKECITDVNIPISNLFSQENIDFQVDFSVVPDCLKKDTL